MLLLIVFLSVRCTLRLGRKEFCPLGSQVLEEVDSEGVPGGPIVLCESDRARFVLLTPLPARACTSQR